MKLNKLVSIVVPVFNEIQNVELVFVEICESMEATRWDYEVVFVDDGSTDGTRDKLREILSDSRINVVFLRRNYGQTAAMHAGIQEARGDYIVTMDGDLQNDPKDIPQMIAKLEEGFDLVHGWRKNRQDKLVSRKIPSRIANWLISRVTGFPIHDLGCTLKVIRADIAKELELYGEMHRFIPILASNNGAKCVEVVVNHRSRQFGTSKYGLSRTVRVLLDLITIRYMQKYFASPMKLFGLIGFWVAAFAIVSVASAVVMKTGWQVDMTGNPLLLLGILSAILSVQFFSVGLIGELAVRIYYAVSGKQNYQIERSATPALNERRAA